MSNLRKVPMYRALTRHQLLMGCDKETVLFVGLVCGFIAFTVAFPFGAIAGLVIFLVGVGLMRKAGKADPLMREVYYRHRDYQDYYSAIPKAAKAKKGKRDY